MNTCSLFMSNASRHQLDQPLYTPVGTKRGSRITYYVFIFFSLDAHPVIKGAPPRSRMIYRLCPFSLIRWDQLITRCLLYIEAPDRTETLFSLSLSRTLPLPLPFGAVPRPCYSRSASRADVPELLRPTSSPLASPNQPSPRINTQLRILR